MKFNHTAHKELWTWLADNPEKGKGEWPGWENNGGKYPNTSNDCFACEYDNKIDWPACDSCPLIWETTYCQPYNSLFTKWQSAFFNNNHKSCSEFARQIANLPVREGVECV